MSKIVNTETKQNKLLRALQAGRTVTHLTALADLKIPNLTAVIGDLRRAGYKILPIAKRDAEGKPYTAWMLSKGNVTKRTAMQRAA